MLFGYDIFRAVRTGCLLCSGPSEIGEVMKRIVIVVGSLRERSFNRQLADAAAELLAGRAEIEVLDFRDLPFMNQDIEFPTPAAVERVRAVVAAADGIWIFTPEYNYSYPGVLKNLLDWLSRPVVPGDRATAVTNKKKLAISSAAGASGGAGARAKLSDLAAAMQMDLMKAPQVGMKLDRAAYTTDVLTLTNDLRTELADEADAFLAYLEV